MPISVLTKNRGFTLIELVVVIVLLGITAVTFTTLITGSVRGYLDTANRQDSAAIARIALDRMGRELREAMPQSVRVSGDAKCVQFLPVNTSFVYVSLGTGSASVIEPPGNYNITAGTFYAAVYPLNADELYLSQALKSVNIGGVVSGQRTLTFGSAFASPYPRSGPGQRIYIVGRPVSFCLDAGGQLYRLVNDVTSAQPTTALAADTALLADHVDYAASSFTSNVGTWQNNALIKIVLTLQNNSNETLSLDHEVWIRNVQ